MGGAIVAGWRAAGIDLSQAVVIRPSGTPVEGVRTVAALREAGAPPKLVVLAVKPQKLDEVARELEPLVTAETVVVSILAGVEAASLRERFPNAGAIVRAMPNLPVAIRRGVTALYSEDADEALKQQLGDLFVALGLAMWTADEDEVRARSDRSPGQARPMSRASSPRWPRPARSAASAARSPRRSRSRRCSAPRGWPRRPAKAWTRSRRRVASPNGTTEAGLAVLDRRRSTTSSSVTIDAAARRGARARRRAREAS